MHVPLGRPVVVHMKSKDVVHSFYLPNFRVKQDVLPGVETRALVPAAKLAGALRDRLRAALRRQPLQDARPRHRRERGRLRRLAARRQSDVAALRYDEDDADAHWGWPWI